MENAKVTVIGFTGSGKTSNMAGMYHVINSGVGKFMLMDLNNDRHSYLQDIWQGICYGATRKWPNPSNGKRTYAFTMSHALKKICTFDWLDYPGAALVDPNHELLPEISASLPLSACLLVMVNGESFAYDGPHADKKKISTLDPKEYKALVSKNLQNNGDLTAMHKLCSMVIKNQRMPPVAIVVTKTDLIDMRWRPYVFDILHDNFSPIFGIPGGDERIVMMSAVTLGEGIPKDMDADPKNMEQPIAFAVLSTLLLYKKKLEAAIRENNSSLKRLDTFSGRLFHSGTIENLKKHNETCKKEIEQYAQDAQNLLSLFSDSKVLYVNDAEAKLKDYFTNQMK